MFLTVISIEETPTAVNSKVSVRFKMMEKHAGHDSRCFPSTLPAVLPALSSCSSWAIGLAGWSPASSRGANQTAQRLWASDEFFWLALSDSCPINPTLCFLIWSWRSAQKQMCREDITGNTISALTPGQEQQSFHMNIQLHRRILYDYVCISNTFPGKWLDVIFILILKITHNEFFKVTLLDICCWKTRMW